MAPALLIDCTVSNTDSAVFLSPEIIFRCISMPAIFQRDDCVCSLMNMTGIQTFVSFKVWVSARSNTQLSPFRGSLAQIVTALYTDMLEYCMCKGVKRFMLTLVED